MYMYIIYKHNLVDKSCTCMPTQKIACQDGRCVN